MADYTSLRAQASTLRALARETADEMAARNRARLAAYRWLASQAQGQVILEDLALRLLTWCEGPYDEGGRRLILSIFETIRKAQEDDADG